MLVFRSVVSCPMKHVAMMTVVVQMRRWSGCFRLRRFIICIV